MKENILGMLQGKGSGNGNIVPLVAILVYCCLNNQGIPSSFENLSNKNYQKK